MAAVTYKLEKGELLELNIQHSKKYAWVRMLANLRHFVMVAGIVAGSWAITWFVYVNSIPLSVSSDGTVGFSLQERIATSSLFATFGSAFIAVFTLFTSSSLARFHENLSILERELAGGELHDASWRRWPFIPRVTKWRIAGKTRYFGINTAKIQFKIGVLSQTFPLPTTEADFKDISVLTNYCRLKRLRNTYLEQLTDAYLREYPTWDCVTDIYRSILRYRVCYLCVWIGVCFVLQSIVFAFFYPGFYSIFTRLLQLKCNF